MRRKAFTLVELLTVIAIMALLYAIFMPVFVQVKKYAQQYVAGDSMMKLGTAASMYLVDNDETFPLGYYGQQNWFGVVGKDGEVDPNTALLKPYIKGKVQPDWSLNAKPWMGDNTGFGYNWGYLGSDYYIPGAQSNNMQCVNPATFSMLGHPSDTIEFGTSSFYYAGWLPKGDDQTYRYGFIDPPRVWFGNPTLVFRHMGDRTVDKKKRDVTYSGQALVLYSDGHLKTIHQKQVKNAMFERGEAGENDDTFGGAQ